MQGGGGGALQPESAASGPRVRGLPSSRGHRKRTFGCSAPEPGTEGAGTGVDPVGVSFFGFLGGHAVRFSRAVTAWCGLRLRTPHREFSIPG